MIISIKTRLYILAIAFAACFGFFESANAMQKGKKPFADPNKYYLLCNGDLNCVQLYFSGSGPVDSNEMLESSKGKHLWDIAPISPLHWTEKRKLKESVMKACRHNKKVVCQLILSKGLQSFTIDVSIKPVKCFNSSVTFLLKYSKVFSNRPLKIPGRSIESEESSEEGRKLGRELRDLPGSIERVSDNEQSDDDREARLPFGFSFGCESENEQQSI